MAHEIVKEREGFHKNLSPLEITDIRNRYVYEHETQKSIADSYGISVKLVYNIVHLKIYKDVNVPPQYELALLDR